MLTVGQVLKRSCDYIQSKKLSQGRLEVEHLIAHILRLARLDLYLRFDQPLEEYEVDAIRLGLARLAKGEPLAYIEGKVPFYDCTINVDSRVLIPRPETEQLVHLVIEALKKEPLEQKVLVDVCTGSGCIGIAIKKALPELTVILTDLSKDALLCAKRNAEDMGVEVECLQGNLLEPLQGRKVDFIVSNPPYISESEFLTLDQHVRDFEPKMALVSGVSGYECYETLAKTAPNECKIWLEIGSGQAAHVTTLFTAAGFKNIEAITDYAGHARILRIFPL